MKKQKQQSFSQRLMAVKNKYTTIQTEKSIVDSSRLLELQKKVEALEHEILMLQLRSILQ
jgi:hypothetical protein